VSRLAGAARAVWRFVVGDDWRVALGVVLALGLLAILVELGVNAWWLLPPTVFALLAWSVLRSAGETGQE
jgi:hypothetical protein